MVALERVHHVAQVELRDDPGGVLVAAAALQEPEPVAHHRRALDVEVLDRLREEPVQRRKVDLARLVAELAVRVEGPDEAAVAARRRAGAEAEQRAVGVAAEGRQDGERLQIGLALRARPVVERQLAGERALERPGLAGGGEAEDGEEELVVADHVREVAAPHDAAARREVRRPAVAGRLVERQLAKRAQLERRQVLAFGLAPVHAPAMPAQG